MPATAAARMRIVEDPQEEEEPRVGERMRELRTFVGLSQMQLARLCKVDISTIGRWERGYATTMRSEVRRNVKLVLEGLEMAAELQRSDPSHSFSEQDFEDYIAGVRKDRLLRARWRANAAARNARKKERKEA